MTVPAATAVRANELQFLHLKNVQTIFKQQKPRCPIKIKITYDGSVAASKGFERINDDTLLWEADIHLPRDSSFRVVIKESHAIKWRSKRDFASIHVKGADVGENENITKDDDKGLVSVKLTLEPPDKAAVVVRKDAEDAVGLLEKKPIAMEKLGRARMFVEAAKRFGEVIGGVHPAARVAVNAFNMLYEKFEEQKTIHKDASKLIDDLQQFLPFTEVIDPALTNEAAKNAIKDFLIVFKETCDFIVQYSSTGILGDLISSQGSKVENLSARLRKAKDMYDWSIKTDVWKINLKIEKIRDNDLLRNLRVSSSGPAGKEFYRTDQCCLEGTRTRTLEQISRWAETSDRKLFWLYGPPGSGKSAIANSVARIFDAQRVLSGCFFCRRDDPDLLDAGKVIPSLATHLATWHQPYSTRLLAVLQAGESNKLASKTLQEQFDVLIRNPVLALVSDEQSRSPTPLIILVDGLDGCGKNRGQRLQLAKILVQVSKLVPWLKLFVASRPLPELRQAFEELGDLLEKLDLNAAGDPTEDMLLYAHHRARQVAQENGLDESWISEEHIADLVRKSHGRFIWISTVFNFIEGHTDVDHAVEVALSASTVDFEAADRDIETACIESLRKAQHDLLNLHPP